MDPYLIVRYFVEFGFVDTPHVCYVVKQIRRGMNPFLPTFLDGKTLFGVAAENRRLIYVDMYFAAWLANPDWAMHHEVYRLESIGAYDVLSHIHRYASMLKVESPLLNHLLNVLQLTLIR